MEWTAHEGKNLAREVNGASYLRYPVKTHFIEVGEDYIEVIRRYVSEHYKEGDLLSISSKIISVCQKNILRKSEMKLSWLARFLSKFASKSKSGIGVNNPYKMQVAINLCGPIKVIWASIAAGFGKLFGKKGVFYAIVGQQITGLDGFYGDEFPEYAQFGILLPKDSSKTCDHIRSALGISCMIVDANDFEVYILGKSSDLSYSEQELAELIRDNPSGQGHEMTPMVLIRKAPVSVSQEN